MHWRRVACFLIGAWLGQMLLVFFVAVDTYRSVDWLLANPAPQARELLKTIGSESGRMLLRYQVAEQSRLYFKKFEWMEIATGLVLLLVLMTTARQKWIGLTLTGSMILLTIFLKAFIHPEIVYLGRQIDFALPAKMFWEQNRLLALQATYVGISVVKLVIGAGLLWYLITYRARSRSTLRTKALGQAGA